MVQRKVILISGKQGSGKTSLSNGLMESLKEQGLQPYAFKFADPLYAIHDACLPVLKSWGIRDNDMKIDKDLLQIIGTEYGRNKISESIWMDICKKRVQVFTGLLPTHVALIDDARFENEFDAFEDAVSIRLNADVEARKKRVSYWREDQNHPSEVSLDAYAAAGKFNLSLDTTSSKKEETLATVMAFLKSKDFF